MSPSLLTLKQTKLVKRKGAIEGDTVMKPTLISSRCDREVLRNNVLVNVTVMKEIWLEEERKWKRKRGNSGARVGREREREREIVRVSFYVRFL